MKVKIIKCTDTTTGLGKNSHIIGSIRDLTLNSRTNAYLEHVDDISKGGRMTTDISEVAIIKDYIEIMTQNTRYRCELWQG